MLRTPAVRFDLTGAVQSLLWEELEEQLAARAEVELEDVRIGAKALHSLPLLGSQLSVRAGWSGGSDRVFVGRIFARDIDRDPGPTLMLEAYDPLFYLEASEDDRFYPAGRAADAVITDILRAWKVPTGTLDIPATKMPRLVFRAQTPADMIRKVLGIAKREGAGRRLLRAREGKVEIVAPGSNAVVWRFEETNVSRTHDRRDILELVTRVKVVGAEDESGRAPVVATIDGDTDFGILQRLVHREEYPNAAAAKKAAQHIIDTEGKPKRTREVEAPDVPPVHRGDKVRIDAAGMKGAFIVESVAHDASAGSMSMSVRAA